MKRWIDWMIHHTRFDFISSEEINAESGTMDFYCRCWWCRRVEQRHA